MSTWNFPNVFVAICRVVLDLETGGFDHQANPILELACCFVQMQDDRLSIKSAENWNVQPIAGMVVEPASLKVTGIDLDDPHRDAQDEASVLKSSFRWCVLK